jgi:hypothetical protein
VQSLPSVNDHLFGIALPTERDLMRVSLSASTMTSSAGGSALKSSSDPEFETSGMCFSISISISIFFIFFSSIFHFFIFFL